MLADDQHVIVVEDRVEEPANDRDRVEVDQELDEALAEDQHELLVRMLELDIGRRNLIEQLEELSNVVQQERTVEVRLLEFGLAELGVLILELFEQFAKLRHLGDLLLASFVGQVQPDGRCDVLGQLLAHQIDLEAAERSNEEQQQTDLLFAVQLITERQAGDRREELAELGRIILEMVPDVDVLTKLLVNHEHDRHQVVDLLVVLLEIEVRP